MKVRRGEMGVVCSLNGGPAGVGEEEADRIGDWERLLKGGIVMSRDAFGVSDVGDNKDNLAKCIEGEEADAGDAEADFFFVFLGLRRGGTGGGGMMVESDKSVVSPGKKRGWECDYRGRCRCVRPQFHWLHPRGSALGWRLALSGESTVYAS